MPGMKTKDEPVAEIREICHQISQEFDNDPRHEFVTRYMSHLGDKAEWRVSMNNGKQIPIALIVRVQAHEDHDESEQVTHSYLALTKITPDEICVTDRILAGSLSQAEVHNVADSAQEKECLELQPRMIIDGMIVR